MAHDVFISHAHKDKNTANAICESLESAQIKCWIAERDISVGQDWTDATRNAIGSSRVMVLVLSDNANAAPHIEREIAHAFYTRRTILPVRLTETPPRRDFLFYLNNVRWFDAFDPPEGQYLEALIANINDMMHGRAFARATMPYHNPTARRISGFPDSRLGALQASRYRSLEILNRISIAVILFSVMWFLWYVYSQWKREGLPEGHNLHATNSAPAALDSTRRAAGDASPSKPEYTSSRFGPWVAPDDAATTLARERLNAADSTALVQPDGASPSPPPNSHHNASDETEMAIAGNSTDVKAAQEQTPGITNQPAQIVTAASPAEKDEPATGEPDLKTLAQTNQSQTAALPLTQPVTPSVQSSPSVESAPAAESIPTESQVSTIFRPSSEEQSLKELVLDYMRTVASDDDSIQERFFAWRVNFYGKGLLSLPGVRESMERYRQEWPVRNWEPRGEPEFPKILHSTHPELYEVLQPFAWTVANGAQRKNGSATLYVRIRKDDKGQLHIIHLELRHP